jgi:endonuclease YncB( thermonuclease family)
MRHRILCLLTAVFVLPFSPALVVTAQDRTPVVDADWTCASFDAWIWAQSAHDAAPDTLAHLDADGDGIACPELTVYGFAPVLWTDTIPEGAEPAQVVSITDGDTFKVSVNGVQDTIRMYHIDTPETTNFGGGLQCGGNEASDYLGYVLGFAPNGTVYIEYDETQRDRFDRRLAYVWYQLGDDVYFVNEVMVRTGWAESETYEPDTKYKDVLDEAEQFSVEKVLGVRLLCGKFGQPAGEGAPSGQQLREAQERQPNQGQFDSIVARETRDPQAQQPLPTTLPQQPSPTATIRTQIPVNASQARDMVRGTVVLQDPDYFEVKNESCHGVGMLAFLHVGSPVRLHESSSRFSEGVLKGGRVNAEGHCQFEFELKYRDRHFLEFHFGPIDDYWYVECYSDRIKSDGDNWTVMIRFSSYGWCEK